MGQLLQSKPLIENEIQSLIKRVNSLKLKSIIPTMKVILVGDHPASIIYTKNKKKFCEKIGAACEIVKLDENILEKDFLQIIKKHNEDNSVHGLFVQLPVPIQLKHIDIGNLISPQKDIDGFHERNIGDLFKGSLESLIPCTPKGIVSLCRHYDIDLEHKDVCIIGRSLIVGKPLSLLLTALNSTVTLCHSKTKKLKEHTKRADIIICAIGKEGFLDKSFLNSSGNQVLIDVGINKSSEGKTVGDINFQEVKELCHSITPVPGGVGPLTILSLAQNLLQATEKTLLT